MRRPILIDDPRTPVPPEALDAPGGFAWWYAEIADEQGNGVVLIWSWGLPFIPGVASRARSGNPMPARSNPSLNVVLYEAGRPSMYVLRELTPDRASYDPSGVWRFGDTVIRAVQRDGQLMVDADINVPVAGYDEPLTGRVRLAGPVPHGQAVESGPGHRWTPLALPAFGTAQLTRPADKPLTVIGKAYHDRNTSPQPLHELGIERWLWGRVGTEQGEKVFYVLESDRGEAMCFGLSFDRAGRCRRHALTADLRGTARTLYGMRACRTVALWEGDQHWLSLDLGAPVDDGPFYRRHLPVVPGIPKACASAELIEPHRVDLARHRMLVKMRVDSEQRPNSVWLPLFQGARDGRLSRLLSSWTRGLS
ncbi:MAG: carotenoid 1,2-hydratase [Myxococcota bacterium]